MYWKSNGKFIKADTGVLLRCDDCPCGGCSACLSHDALIAQCPATKTVAFSGWQDQGRTGFYSGPLPFHVLNGIYTIAPATFPTPPAPIYTNVGGLVTRATQGYMSDEIDGGAYGAGTWQQGRIKDSRKNNLSK